MIKNAITLRPTEYNTLAMAGQAANGFAAKSAFIDYRERKAKNTLRRQDNDLALFAQYLRAAGLQVGDFAQNPHAWSGISWGLVEGFARWQLQQGYAVTSVNVRLATIKGYARLALKAGALDQTEYAMMTTVKGYSHKESRRVIALGVTTIEKLRKHQNIQVEDIRAAGKSWKENDIIFPSTKGTPMDPSNLYHNFKRLLIEAGLPDIRFHDLRHTAATLMLQQGVHPKVVQERLGHSDISMTLNTYSHVLPILQDEAAEKLDVLLTPINVSFDLKKLVEREPSSIPLPQKIR